jgi:nucleoid-associated protein YgaU
MQRDLKIGLVVGLVLAAIAAVWLSTRPSLSIKARMQEPDSATPRETATPPHSPDTESQQEAIDKQPRFTMGLPDTASTETTTPEQEKIETRKFHVVRKGETLSDISYRYYGSAAKWQKILNANHKTIEDPHKLRPGTRLIIPY